MRKECNVLKRGMAVLFALAMIVSGICFMGMDVNKVYAATSTVKDSTGYNDEGYFVKEYEEISTYKTAGTYPILNGTEYTDAQDWLFAGWYTTEECTTSIGTTESGSAWAKFVHIDVLSVKCQVENDVDADTDKTNMRLISTLDSLKYDTVGFKVRYNGGDELDFPVSKVFKRINASETNGNECGYSPVAFHETSEYFMTFSLLNIANKNFSKPFYIEPYWVTLDGTEVRGASRFARVEDRYLEIVNVPVRLHADTIVTGGSVTVDYSMKDEDGSTQDLYELYSIDGVVQYDNGTVFDTVTVSDHATNRVVTVTATEQTEGAQAKGMFVNLRFQMVAETMPSTSTFEIASDDFNVSNFIFKNFPLTYSGGYDISWYTGYEDSDTFAIASAADLYGLATLSNGTAGVGDAVDFSGKTIYLASDITVNEGDPSEDNWAKTAPKYEWIPIGKSNAFEGIFEGQGNTINGIYVNDDGTKANYVGLFGTVAEDAEIRNFSLENSCFINTSAEGLGWGSIVGRCSGEALIQDVYSNAQLICSGRQIGGILGVKNTADTEVNVNSCWFEGSITLNGDGDCARAAGGIVGASAGGTVTIGNCLNTGNITTNRTNIGTKQQALGGLFGIDWGMSTITIKNSLNAGTITVNVDENYSKNDIGSIVGRIGNKDSVFTITDTYATNESWTGDEAVAGVGSKNGGNKGSKTLEVTRQSQGDFNGHVAYDTISDGLSVLTSKVKDGAWAIREQANNLKQGVPVPAAFADNNWIDVAWYYDAEKSDDKGETYSISTAEELYGFSAISRGYTFGEETIQGYNFDGDTVQLANDITVNDGKATSWEKGTIPSREWTPIGNSTTSFQGTFDGQKHYIKGIYVNATTQNAGLFGYAESATIQDLQLINSYIHSTVDRVGGIAGYYTGNMYRVYCDAIVVSTNNAASDCGGLIGYYEKIASTDKISKCWFAGTAKGYTRTGGIVGYLRNGRKEISDTVVTGTVISTTSVRNAQTDGIVGSINNYAGAVVDIKSSIGAGTMQDSYTGTNGSQTGGVVGYKPEKATVTINNVYTTYSKGVGTQNNDLNNSPEPEDYPLIEDIDDIKGSKVYTNDVMNLGYYMYDSTWVARTTDIPVPRCFVGTVVDENDIVEDTSAHTAWYDADTEATTFEIKTENDLLGFAVIVNEGEKFSGKTIKLAKDMDLNRGWNAPETVDEEAVEPDVTWTPIGNNTKIDSVNNRFQGTFDGQGYEIKGIYVDSTSSYVGLFGYVNNNATIKNLRLTNSYFNGDNASALGWGSIAGQSDDATLLNIYSDAVMCYLGRQIGGFVGRAAQDVTIERCWFDGEIDASYVKDGNAAATGVGGIVGATVTPTGFTTPELDITDCLNTGNLKSTATHSTAPGTAISFGGILGTDWNQSSVTISGCLNKGSITTELYQGVGAIVGRANVSGSEYTITGCYALDTSITNRTFEDIGLISNASVSPDTQEARCPSKEIDQLVGEGVYAEGGLDLNYATWIARKTDVPVPTYFVGSVVAEEDTVKDNTGRVYVDTTWYTQDKNASTYSIETAHELAGLAKLVNDDGITFDGITINLLKDIDFNKDWTAPATTADEVVAPVNTWMPIGNSSSVSFQGTFNGNGNTIRGIYVDENVETTYTGLFGYTKTCAVKDLRLENSYFSTTNPYMGSIIGYGNGTLTNVYSDAIMHSTNIEVGGLVGSARQEDSTNRTLSMTGCWFDGDIRVENSATDNTNSALIVYVGGLLGYAYNCDATINTCLYTGDITLIYTAATVAPNTRSGGLVGSENGTYAFASISNSISAGTLTGIMQGDATSIGILSTTIGQVRSTSTTCSNVYDMSVVTKVIGETSSTFTAKCGGSTTNVDTVKSNIHQTYDKEDIFGLGAQLLTNLDFVQDAEEAIWAARRGQIPAPAGLVADSDKLNVQFGKADQEIADDATGDTAEDPYVIENVEELYGFAILSRTNNFAGKFIKLSDDIDVLDLNPGESAEDWAEGTAASLPWYSIGTSSNRFAGHFDGNSKTISGIYINDDNSYLGLFAATETGSTITDLRLTNSYINYTGDGTAYTGSVVGDLRGDMTNVYSDAIVNSNGERTGGLVGQATDASEDENYAVDITNCWYDGQLTSSKTNAAGLLARINGGTVNVDNCLSTGTITTTATSANENNAVAGICSQVAGEAVATISDTISAGEITDAAHGKNVKSVVGYISNGTVSFADVFATKTSYARSYPSKGSSGSYTGTVLRTQESDRFIGYCVEGLVEESVQLEPKLEFGTNEWTIRTSDVPVPTCFADLVTPVTADELNTQVGLDYLNTTLGTTLTLANAVDMGEGNYVLNATVNDTVYATYKSTLEGLGFGTPAVENVADRVHSVSYKQTNPDWVVTLTYVETTDALTISINTDTDSLSDKLVSSEDEITYATGDVKLTMLQMYEMVVDDEGNETPLSDIYADLSSYYFNNNSYWYGNSFVFQVSEDHFVVNDGGAKEEYDDLVNYMKAAVGTTEDGVQKPVYIDAWTISHQHGDHADVLKAVADDPTLANGIYVDAFYISEPNAKILTDNALYDDAEKQYYGMTLFAKNESGEQSDIYRMHTGQRYNFNGLVMDVIQTQDQIPYSAYGDYNANNSGKKDFNTASTVTLFSTATKKVLIGGDANYVNMGYIMKAYDTDETDDENYTPTSLLQNIDVFAAFHHGKNMSMQLSVKDTSFIDYLTYGDHTFDYVLYPCSLVYGDASDPVGAFPNAGEANTYLNGKTKAYAHFGNGNVEITLTGATTE